MASSLRPLESEAQSTIVELAGWRRWRVYHTRDSRGSQGGYPDLTLVRDRVIFVELKRVGEKPRRDQVEWLDELAQAGAETYLWTLDDLTEIERVLERRWTFVPFGAVVGDVDVSQETLGGLAGPRLIDRKVSFAPRSAWIPDVGRRDARG